MTASKKLVLLLLPLMAGAGCAPAKRYQPAPISPVAAATAYEKRTLADPALKAFLEKNLGHAVAPWPRKVWDLPTLELAALYFNPQMEISRDQAAVAQGATITAGEHPNPSVSLTPGIPSPYLFDLPLIFRIETHGKRALRIEEAQHLSSAAKIALAETAWKVVSGARRALLAYQVAVENLALEQSTERLEDERVKLLGRMLAVGEGPRPAFETARLALANARFAIRADEVQVATSKAALAAAIGVPVAALDGIQTTWRNFARLPALASLSPERIQRDAVLNRLDVRRALEQYAAADAALRLQLARQYPDFNIGPGYTYEEGNNFFAVPFSLVLPIRNRNQGPIAEAEARRRQVAAQFLSTQARAIAESQQALARYRFTLAELNEANRPIEAQRRRVALSEHALAAGEADRVQLNTLLLEGTVYLRQHLEALAQAQAALGALEDAVEKPLGREASISQSGAETPPARGRKESDQ